jgi:hypothetical protein
MSGSLQRERIPARKGDESFKFDYLPTENPNAT